MKNVIKKEAIEGESRIAVLAVILAIIITMVTAPIVHAMDGKSNESKKSSKANKAPAVVRHMKAGAKGKGKTLIKWSKVKGADGYYVYKAMKKTGKYRKCETVGSGNKTKCTDKYKKIRKNKKYYYKVYAFRKNGKNKRLSKSAKHDPAMNTLSYKKKIRMTATAYSGGGLCANGKRCKVGRVAVDPRVIPLGTWLYVKGYGFCQACDTGGAIKGNRIDLYYNSEGRCNRYGVRSTQVYVLR